MKCSPLVTRACPKLIKAHGPSIWNTGATWYSGAVRIWARMCGWTVRVCQLFSSSFKKPARHPVGRRYRITPAMSFLRHSLSTRAPRGPHPRHCPSTTHRWHCSNGLRPGFPGNLQAMSRRPTALLCNLVCQAPQGSPVAESESCSVMSNSLRPHGLYSPWNSLGQNTGVGSLSLLQGIIPTQGSNPGLLRCGRLLYQLSHKGSPRILEWVSLSLLQRIFLTQESNQGLCIAGGPLPFLPPWVLGELGRKHQISLLCFMSYESAFVSL